MAGRDPSCCVLCIPYLRSIPDRVRKDAIINVVRVSHDYGPSTRLITAWSAIPDTLQHRDTIIVCLDDDMVYHPDTVATLVRHALHHPDSAVAFAGYTLRGRPYVQPNFQYAKRREERADIAWKNTQMALQSQIQYAAASAAANHSTNSAALAAAAAALSNAPAHLSQHVICPSIDPALLPVLDPLPDVPLDADPYSAPLPNPNDVYETELVDVLCGWRGGICLRKRFLDERLWRDYADMPEAAMQADDEWSERGQRSKERMLALCLRRRYPRQPAHLIPRAFSPPFALSLCAHLFLSFRISAQLARNGINRRVILAPFDVSAGGFGMPAARARAGVHATIRFGVIASRVFLEVLSRASP